MIDTNNKYVVRLYNEWVFHRQIIIACDFDDTISPWRFSKEELQNTIDTIKRAQFIGAYLIIHTACHPDRFDYIKEYCKSIGLRVDSINSNPVDLPYGKHGKVYANIFLDDRAGLDEAVSILNLAMSMYRGSNSISHIQHIGEIA